MISTQNSKLRIQNFLIGPDALALYFFIVASYIMLWPLAGYFGSSTVSEGDCLTQMWSMSWVIHSLTTDPANLFNGNLFYPYINNLAYSDATIAQAFQAMPIVLVTGNIVLAYNILTWFSFALSGWGMYLLVKDITGSRVGGLLAGIVFAFAPYRMGRISQLNLLSTQWIPFCFLFLRRLLLRDIGRANGDMKSPFKSLIRQDWGIALAFSFFFVLNALSSFYYLLFITPLLAIYLVFIYATHRRWPGLALLVKLAVAGLIALLIILPTALPYFQVAGEQAAERTRSEVEKFSANYRFYLAVPDNNLFWGRELKSLGGTGGERQLFPGAVGLLLGTIGLVGPMLLWLRRKKSPTKIVWAERWGWLIIGVFSLLMSFGLVLRVKGLEIPMPYAFFRDYVPSWNGLRTAVRYGLFVTMTVAVLAGFGVAFLTPYFQNLFNESKNKISNSLESWSPGGLIRNKAKIASGLVIALLLFSALWEYRTQISYINPNILPNPPQVYRWLGEASNAGPVLELPLPEDVRNGPSIRDFYSTFNLQPLVGGINAYVPPVYNDLRDLTKSFPNQNAINLLQGMGVRWIVFHIEDENTPLSAEDWAKIEPHLNSTKELKLAKGFLQDKIKVYELAPNPWLLKLAQSLPEKSDVIFSDYRRNQPTYIEIAATIFRRYGHNIYGNDRAGYRFLSAPPPGRPLNYGLFSADEDPAAYGFTAADERWSNFGLKFYQRQTPPVAAYDVARDSKLLDYAVLNGSLELEIGKNELKFNGKSVGSGKELNQKGYINLSLGSLAPQILKLSVPGRADTSLNLEVGASIWRSPELSPGDKIRLEPTAGQSLILSRVELLNALPNQSESLTTIANSPALMSSSSRQDGNRVITTFNILTPPLSPTTPGKYTFTLDVYKRPWGTHPSGHFGNWSIALTGDKVAHKVEFSFDPLKRETNVTIDGARADAGSEVIRPDEGDWAVFIALWRNNPQNPKTDTQVGVSRLYEFRIFENKLQEVNLWPNRPLIFQPPL